MASINYPNGKSIPGCILRIEIFWLLIFALIGSRILAHSWQHPIGVSYSPEPVDDFWDLCTAYGYTYSLFINSFLQPILLTLAVISLIGKKRNFMLSLTAIIISSLISFCILFVFRTWEAAYYQLSTAIYGTPRSHAVVVGHHSNAIKTRAFLNDLECILYWDPPRWHEGDKVSVKFKVNKDGKASSPHVEHSSGFVVTDKCALKTINDGAYISGILQA